MAQLPSYEDAISRLDWLGLVAPYVPVSELSRLCSVNRHFYNVFASRLWNDPLTTVRKLGLDPSDDLDWFFHFIFVRSQRTRSSTLALVTTLDFRSFGKANTHFWSDNNSRSLPETFKRFPKLFPNLRCMLIDGHTEADPATLATSFAASEATHRPLVLSLASCETHLPSTFFSSDYVRDLVYLDLSDLPGSLQPFFAAASTSRSFLNLKLLKIRGRELHNEAALALFSVFKSRLWSLDLANNSLGDATVEHFAAQCFSSPSLRSDHRMREEGRLTNPNRCGSAFYGRFDFIEESEWSSTFDHPDRHFADAPAYSADPSRDILQEHEAVRSDGRDDLRLDTVEHVKAALAGDAESDTPGRSHLPHLDVCCAPFGLTHLDVTGTQFTSFGIEKLLRLTPGQLEKVSCDAPLWRPDHLLLPRPWHKETKLYGVMGSAHAFRPVVSSNLRALRVHHSFVTQIPTLETLGLSTIARLWVAETSLLEQSEMAYPQAFEPDLNPRLTSLTLTKVPRRSVGPLLFKLIQFLKLAAVQEQAIACATPTPTLRRSPAVLNGLRHIRLEFEADPIEDPAGWSNDDDLDADDLMKMDDGEGFSFFQDENKPRSQPNSASKPELPPRPSAGASRTLQAGGKSETGPSTLSFASANSSTDPSDRLQHAPFSDTRGERLAHVITWEGSTFEAHVWIGPGVLGPKPAINAYMAALGDPALRNDHIGPATPAHVRAGVPSGELLFYAAWDAMIMPRELTKPGRADLHGMRDVIEGLKTFRLDERRKFEAKQEGHLFWTGKIEVVAQQSMAHYRSSTYWR